jgi:hypothetical protein
MVQMLQRIGSTMGTKHLNVGGLRKDPNQIK